MHFFQFIIQQKVCIPEECTRLFRDLTVVNIGNGGNFHTEKTPKMEKKS